MLSSQTIKKAYGKPSKVRVGKTTSGFVLFISVLEGKHSPLLICSVSHQRAMEMKEKRGEKVPTHNLPRPWFVSFMAQQAGKRKAALRSEDSQ